LWFLPPFKKQVRTTKDTKDTKRDPVAHAVHARRQLMPFVWDLQQGGGRFADGVV
jgi:hypothetical protein